MKQFLLHGHLKASRYIVLHSRGITVEFLIHPVLGTGYIIANKTKVLCLSIVITRLEFNHKTYEFTV